MTGQPSLNESAAVHAQQPNTEPLLDIDAVASLLGVPKSWIYERTRRHTIPAHRLGRYLRFRWSEVERWIESGDSGLELESPSPSVRAGGSTTDAHSRGAR
jgi:excisionase family DNA binding protein